jgi:hypothetical protein
VRVAEIIAVTITMATVLEKIPVELHASNFPLVNCDGDDGMPDIRSDRMNFKLIFMMLIVANRCEKKFRELREKFQNREN